VKSKPAIYHGGLPTNRPYSQAYNCSYTELLHDLTNVIKNVFNYLPKQLYDATTGLQKEIDTFCSDVMGKCH